MRKQFFEDVEQGMELPELSKHPTTRQLVKWAAASEDWNEGHYDINAARQMGLSQVLVHGRLKANFLVQLLTDWVGEDGYLKKFNCQFRGMDFPGTPLICKGKVINKYVVDDEHSVECEVWIENSEGKKTTAGQAIVVLPSKVSKG